MYSNFDHSKLTTNPLFFFFNSLIAAKSFFSLPSFSIQERTNQVAQPLFNEPLINAPDDPDFPLRPPHSEYDLLSKDKERVPEKKFRLKKDRLEVGLALLPFLNACKALSPAAYPFLLPPNMWFHYTSEEKHLHNINLQINALPARKVYHITLGHKQSQLSFSIEVVAGKALHFPSLEKQVDLHSSQKVLSSPIFCRPQENFMAHLFPENTLVGQIWRKCFSWKPQTHVTLCDILISDPDNPTLQYGPQTYIVPLSDLETIRFIHRDPYATSQEEMYGPSLDGNSSEFVSMTTGTMQVTDPLAENNYKQSVSLVGYDKNHSGAFLEVEQSFV